MAANKIDRIEHEIERTRVKITEFQNKLKELEAQRTEQENVQIVQLVRSMCMTREELAVFLRSGAINAMPVKTKYHKQEDNDNEE
jgi:hypothetical protein